MFEFEDAPNDISFADALRAGNPESIVAFNNGDTTHANVVSARAEDYTAGEMNKPQQCIDMRPEIGGLRYHLLSFIGSYWSRRPLRFTGGEMAAVTRNITDNGGVMTWDLPFDNQKGIAEDALSLLRVFAAEYRRSKMLFPKTSVEIARPEIQCRDRRLIHGKVRLRSGDLSGLKFAWNGRDTVPEKNDGENAVVDLPPEDGIFTMRRGDMVRTYHIPALQKLSLTEDFSPVITLNAPDGGPAASEIRLAWKAGALILNADIYEDEPVPPADPDKLGACSQYSRLSVFLHVSRDLRFEFIFRRDNAVFMCKQMQVELRKDIVPRWTGVKDGRYSLSVEIPFANFFRALTPGNVFLVNFAQTVNRNGRLRQIIRYGTAVSPDVALQCEIK